MNSGRRRRLSWGVRRNVSWRWRRCRSRCGRRPLPHRRNNFWTRCWRGRWSLGSWNRRRCGRRRWSGRGSWRRNYRPRYHRRHGPRRRRNPLFLLRDRSQHISWPGDLRQIDLGLDFFFAAHRARGLRSRRRRFRRTADVDPHFIRFVILDGTGMGLLLRHPDGSKRIENGFAFNFQFPGEIVDSNLAHPAFLVLRVALRSSSQPSRSQRPALARHR